MPNPLFPLSFAVLALLEGTAVSASAPPNTAPSPSPTTGKAVQKAAPKTDPREGQKLFQQAIRLTEEGKTTAAEQIYRKLLKLFPQAGSAWANLGLLAGQDNRLSEAEAYLLNATKFEPKAAPFWAQLSSVQLRRGRLKQAEASARQAILLDPKNRYGLGNLASSLMQQKRYADSITPLKSLNTLENGKNQQVVFSLIFALTNTNRKREAVVFAQKLAAHYPDQPKIQQMLADLASQTGNIALAQKAYTAASKLSPKDIRTGINAAIASEMAGDPVKAKAQLEKVIKANPNDPLPHFQLGRLYYLYPKLVDKPMPENFKLAESSFREAMVLEPKNPLYLVNLGLAMLYQGPKRYTDATGILNAALSLSPKNTVARMGLAYISEQDQDPEGAIKQYQTLLADDPNSDEARRRLAALFYATDKKKEAFKEYQILADKTTGDKKAAALKELARLKTEGKDWLGAQKTYEEVLALSPKDTDALVGLGKSLEQQKQPDAAREKYEAAVTASPKNVGAQEALGVLLLNQRKTAEATVHYQKFVAAVPTSNTARWQLAQLYKEQKRDDEALSEMRKLTLSKTDPTRITYLLAPSSLLIERQRYKEAVEDLSRLVAENRGAEENRELRYALADAQEKAGESTDAETTLTKLGTDAKDSETKVRAYSASAAFYERRNRPEDAIQSYKDALTIDPASIIARTGLLRVFDIQKKPDAAAAFLESLALSGLDGPDPAAVSSVEQVYNEVNARGKYLDFARRVAAKYPKNPDALRLCAQALQKSNGADQKSEIRQEIIGLYQQITTLDPKNSEAFYQIGLQQEALGKKEDAISSYKNAATLEEEARTTQAPGKAKVALARLGITLPPSAPKNTGVPQAPAKPDPSASPSDTDKKK
jgi:tetratricopeptide (TPR) repeat protein